MSSGAWTLGCTSREVTSEFPEISETMMLSGFPIKMKVRMMEMKLSDGATKIFAFVTPDPAIVRVQPVQPQRLSQSTDTVVASHSRQLSPKLSLSGKKYVNPYAFPCFNCSKSFTTRYMLRRHEVIHDGLFSCTELGCGATYRNQTTLTKHRVVEHGLQLHPRPSPVKSKLQRLKKK